MSSSPGDQPGVPDVPTPDPQQAEETAAMLRELATSVALLPHTPSPDGEDVPEGAIALPLLEQDGRQFIPVFTSEDSLREAGADVDAANRIPVAELAANWPSDEIWLAVNPANEEGYGLPPQVVRMLPELAGVASGSGNGQVNHLDG